MDKLKVLKRLLDKGKINQDTYDKASAVFSKATVLKEAVKSKPKTSKVG